MLAQKSWRGLRVVPDRDLVAVTSWGKATEPEVRHDVELFATLRGARRVSIPSNAGSSATGVPGTEKYPGAVLPGPFCPKGAVAARLTHDKLPRLPYGTVDARVRPMWVNEGVEEIRCIFRRSLCRRFSLGRSSSGGEVGLSSKGVFGVSGSSEISDVEDDEAMTMTR